MEMGEMGYRCVMGNVSIGYNNKKSNDWLSECRTLGTRASEIISW